MPVRAGPGQRGVLLRRPLGPQSARRAAGGGARRGWRPPERPRLLQPPRHRAASGLQPRHPRHVRTNHRANISFQSQTITIIVDGKSFKCPISHHPKVAVNVNRNLFNFNI